MATERKQRWPAVALFFLLFFSYAYVNGGWGFNQYSRLDLVHSLVLHRTFAIDAHHNNTGDKSVFGGHYYSDKAPGIAFLALPAFALSATVLKTMHLSLEFPESWNALHWMTSIGSVGILTALGGVALFALLSRFLARRFALIAVLATYLGSLPFPYATALFSHGAVIGLLSIALWAALVPGMHCVCKWKYVATLGRVNRYIIEVIMGCLIGVMLGWGIARLLSPQTPSVFMLIAASVILAILFGLLTIQATSTLIKWHGRHHGRSSDNTLVNDLIAGLACGLAVASEYTAGLALIGVFVLLLSRGYRRAITFSLAALFPLLLIPLYNWVCFGSVFSIGYENLQGWEGMRQGFFGVSFPPDPEHIRVLLFSAVRGLFFWTPFFLLGFLGLVPLWKRDRFLAVTCLAVIVLQITAIGGYRYWDGGTALGPRHLAAMIPFLAIMAGFGLQWLPPAGIPLAFLSILLVGSATLINPGTPFVSDPLIQFYLPRLEKGEFVQNFGSVLGLHPAEGAALYFLFLSGCLMFLYVRLSSSVGRVHRALRTWTSFLFPPLCAFLFSVLLSIIAAAQVGVGGWHAPSYAHWDSGHYLTIAQRGYEFMSCSKVPGYNPAQWCGNTGWFPGYPILIHSLAATGLSGESAGVLLSLVFFFCILLLLWNVFLKGVGARSRWAVLLLAGVFPGSIYYHAVFPISTVLLCMMLTYWFSARRNWIAAGLTGFVGAFVYPTGIFGVLLYPLPLFFNRGTNRKTRRGALLSSLFVSGTALLGFLSVLLLHFTTTGVWDAFFKVQAKYGFGHHNPFRTASALLKPVFQLQFWHVAPQNLQSFFVVILLLLAIGIVMRHRKTTSPMDLALLAHGILFWLFPMILGGGLSIYRAEGLLLPIVVLLRRLPAWLLLILVIIGALLKYQLAMLFFRGALI